jgi:hypothetical protein
VNISSSSITHTITFQQAGDGLNDFITIDGIYFLLATDNGILKTTHFKLLTIYAWGKGASSLSQISASTYLVGFPWGKLVAWDEQRNTQPFQISEDRVCLIKNIIPNNFIIKTKNKGLKILKIDEIKSKKFSLEPFLAGK